MAKQVVENKPSAERLKQLVWDTITDLREGRKDVKHANAVSHGAKTIVSVVRAEIQIANMVARYTKKPATSIKRLESF